MLIASVIASNKYDILELIHALLKDLRHTV